MLLRVGDVEIWRILETNGPLTGVFDFFPDLTQSMLDEFDDAILPGSIKPDPETGEPILMLPVQAFLLKTPERNILVDACVGNHKTVPQIPQWENMDGERFMASLTAADVAPEDIDIVMCTHLHVDHSGWTTELKDGVWVPTFPNARVLATEADIDHARAAAEAEGPQGLSGKVFSQNIQPLVDAGLLSAVAEDAWIDPAARLIHTPGHTPGHVSVGIGTGDEPSAIITGDTIHFSVQCAVPSLNSIADHAPDVAAVTREKLFADLAQTNAIALGSHMPLPSVGRIEKRRGGYRWKMLPD